MIITILRETATAMNLAFGHGHEAYHNLLDPTDKYVWSLPITFNPEINLALQLKTTYFPILWFGKPNRMDSTALELEAVTQEMEGVCNAFLLRLATDPRVDSITNAHGEPDYHKLSANATGVTVAFRIKLKAITKYCP